MMINSNRTLVKNPYQYRFNKIVHPHIGNQKDTFGERLAFFMNKYGLSVKNFVEMTKPFADKKKIRITDGDLENYLYRGVSPKIDKLYVICEVMGVSLDYFCGYGSKNRPSRNQILEARYRKRKKD